MPSDRFGYNPALPEGIRDVFMWLCQEVAALQNKWSFYLELFSSEDNTALLSDVAGSFFQAVEESLRNDMTMAICRLSDPCRSDGKANLSLATLVRLCNDLRDVDRLLTDFLDACAPVRRHRNKRVAHNDLRTRIEPRDDPLPGIGRSEVDRVLQLAGALLNAVYQHFADGELCFRPWQIGGVEALMYWLKAGRAYQEKEDRRLRGEAGESGTR
jgi:AbiU2